MVKDTKLEEAKVFLKKNKITDIAGIEQALKAQWKDILQAALEAEMDDALG